MKAMTENQLALLEEYIQAVIINHHSVDCADAVYLNKLRDEMLEKFDFKGKDDEG
jgi:hypothetical protein